jgi:hypothetical protein
MLLVGVLGVRGQRQDVARGERHTVILQGVVSWVQVSAQGP